MPLRRCLFFYIFSPTSVLRKIHAWLTFHFAFFLSVLFLFCALWLQLCPLRSPSSRASRALVVVEQTFGQGLPTGQRFNYLFFPSNRQRPQRNGNEWRERFKQWLSGVRRSLYLPFHPKNKYDIDFLVVSLDVHYTTVQYFKKMFRNTIKAFTQCAKRSSCMRGKCLIPERQHREWRAKRK